MADVHFKNFLGMSQSSVCGIANVPERLLTLNPVAVTCDLCLKALGRFRADGFGVPTGKKPKGDA